VPEEDAPCLSVYPGAFRIPAPLLRRLGGMRSSTKLSQMAEDAESTWSHLHPRSWQGERQALGHPAGEVGGARGRGRAVGRGGFPHDAPYMMHIQDHPSLPVCLQT
jgi:hypothetical protein